MDIYSLTPKSGSPRGRDQTPAKIASPDPTTA